MELPSTPPGAEKAGFLRPGPAQPEMKATGEVPAASWASAHWAISPQHLFMELIVHVSPPFPLQIKSRDNPPGWTRTLPEPAGASRRGDAGRLVRPGPECTLSTSGESAGTVTSLPPGGRRFGKEGPAGMRRFPVGSPPAVIAAPRPQSSSIQAAPSLSTAFDPPATLLDLVSLRKGE